MRKLFRFLSSRFFWTALIILIEIGLLFVFIFALSNLDKNIALYVYVAIEILSIFQMIFIISTNGNIAYKLAWVFFVGAIPIVGFFCYLIFGNKKISKRQIKKIMPIYISLKDAKYDTKALDYIKKNNPDIGHIFEYLYKQGGNPPFGDTIVKYFPLGDIAWPVMLEKLQNAKHFIFMEYFIIAYGKMWDSILTILKQKSIEGLDIRIIYDDFGSITTLPSDFEQRMINLGIKCHAYNRFKPLLDVKMNNRDHRKLLIIDGHTGFTGGINIADEYVNLKMRFGHWKDNAIMLEGEGVWGLTTMFLTLWDFLDNSLSDYKNFYYEKYANELSKPVKESGFVQPYSDFPFDNEAISQTLYINILMRAKDYVFITTPYLILSNELQFALTSTAKQGVKVIILTPHIPDKKLVFQITRSYYSEFLVKGIKIYEFTPGFNHEKIMIVDDKMALSGTCNFEYRSLFLHFEDCIFVSNSSEIIEMRNSFLNMVSKSTLQDINKYVNSSIFKRWILSLLRIFAPLI